MATSRNASSGNSRTQKSWASKLFGLITLQWLRPQAAPPVAATHNASTGSSRTQQSAARSAAQSEATPATAAEATKVYFSPGDACLQAIIAQIQRARKSLDICVFTISDDRIADAILACHRNRVPVRIITDNEKLLDQGSDIERFARAGIPVRIDRTEAHMHHKFALIDGKTAVTGSYNWTRSAAIYNMENVLVSSESAVVKAYAGEFQRLWNTLDAF